jgi:hypothetical protein
MRTWNENYGADADGNRGEMRTFYELEGTKQEREDIAEILYDSFIEGEVQGLKEIDYEGLTIEVEVSDYQDELIELAEADEDIEDEVLEWVEELKKHNAGEAK